MLFIRYTNLRFFTNLLKFKHRGTIAFSSIEHIIVKIWHAQTFNKHLNLIYSYIQTFVFI